MKKKYLFKILTDQYIKNIAHLTDEYTNALHLIYREGDWNDEEVKWIFWELEDKATRFNSYLSPDFKARKGYVSEEEIYVEAKKAKENYDIYK